MCKESYTVEDFVLDPEFQKWILHPNKDSNTYWDDFLSKHPHFKGDIALAKKIVVNMSRRSTKVNDDQLAATWYRIEQMAETTTFSEKEPSIVPLNAETTLKNHPKEVYYTDSRLGHQQFYRLLAILVITFGLAICFNLFLAPEETPLAEVLPEVVLENHFAPPGVKSSFNLPDGSKVMLNAGSSLSYVRGFESHQRFMELEGEAFFEVAKDVNRPFKVKSGDAITTALGTSFNIKAYDGSHLDISLISGKVEVLIPSAENSVLQLEKGQGIRMKPGRNTLEVFEFDEDLILAWTRKTIVFRNTPIYQIKNVLENWYGVKITFMNSPERDLEISGKFIDQSLENVLKGLSHSARFKFVLKDDQVFLTFNP